MSAEAPTVRTEINDRGGGPKSRLVREAPTRAEADDGERGPAGRVA